MALKKMFHRLTASVDELDTEDLKEFCSRFPQATPIAEINPREPVIAVGEITSLRIVPRKDKTRWLEASISDGTGTLVAMWTGRRRIAGVKPGQRLLVQGRCSPTGPGGRMMMYNPIYELL
ncbi:MAG: hypothetical protein QOG03_598 [Actinomycetota bacterium]|nr:hypothetical protein [Actinomycetota bacterium]